MHNTVTRDDILDAALKVGTETGWEKLSLSQLARHLNTSLAAIHAEFSQKDDLVDGWFDRADASALKNFPQRETSHSKTQCLQKVMQSWLDALSPYHKLTGEMLLYKLEPGHIHLQAAGVLRISRTVQWFREAAGLQASHLRRIGQEIALSTLFVGIFIHWLNDKSPHQQHTRQRLSQAMRKGQRIQLWQ